MKFFRSLVIIALLFVSLRPVQGRQLMEHLDFEEGDWVMVGVSLHNYMPMDLQNDLGTFICKNKAIFQMIKEKWEFEEVFEDYCDYHYAIKFYKDGELFETYRINLYCGYITLGGLSYQFKQDDLAQFQSYFRPIRWSRIRFRDLDLLKISVEELSRIPNVYWYGDVKQYSFKGQFSINVDGLPWYADRDSVIDVVTDRIRKEMQRDDFYVGLKYWLISDDLERMTLRLEVFCDEEFYMDYKGGDVITRWRNHFSEQSFVQIVVIGLSKEEYYKAMRGYGDPG